MPERAHPRLDGADPRPERVHPRGLTGPVQGLRGALLKQIGRKAFSSHFWEGPFLSGALLDLASPPSITPVDRPEFWLRPCLQHIDGIGVVRRRDWNRSRS